MVQFARSAAQQQDITKGRNHAGRDRAADDPVLGIRPEQWVRTLPGATISDFNPG
jgi:hypothetical protein